MNLILDGIILAVCIISVVLGAKRGFIKSVMGVCTLIVSLLAAYTFTPAVSVYIEKQPFVENISDSITDTLKSLSKNDSGTYDLERLYRDMPDAFRQILQRYGADEKELADSVPPTETSEAEAVETLSRLIADPVVKAISGALAFLGIFTLSVIALKLLTWLLDLVFQLPVLKSANTMLGLLVGIVCAFLWAWILSSLTVVLIHAMSSISPELFSDSLVDSTVILKFFRDNDLYTFAKALIR